MKFVMAVIALIGATLLSVPAVSATPIAHQGPCLLGHVNPDDPNSACTGSDADRWPPMDEGPTGPIIPCDEHNVGEQVKTQHAPQKWRYWRCRGSDGVYQWEEILTG